MVLRLLSYLMLLDHLEIVWGQFDGPVDTLTHLLVYKFAFHRLHVHHPNTFDDSHVAYPFSKSQSERIRTRKPALHSRCSKQTTIFAYSEQEIPFTMTMNETI